MRETSQQLLHLSLLGQFWALYFKYLCEKIPIQNRFKKSLNKIRKNKIKRLDADVEPAQVGTSELAPTHWNRESFSRFPCNESL